MGILGSTGLLDEDSGGNGVDGFGVCVGGDPPDSAWGVACTLLPSTGVAGGTGGT